MPIHPQTFHNPSMYNHNSGNSVAQSVCCACFGVLCLIGSFPFLWWNEGRAAQTWASLDEVI